MSVCGSRTQLKSQQLMSLETSEGFLEALGSQALASGAYLSTDAAAKNIDNVSLTDVANVRSRLFASYAVIVEAVLIFTTHYQNPSFIGRSTFTCKDWIMVYWCYTENKYKRAQEMQEKQEEKKKNNQSKISVKLTDFNIRYQH